jgi:dethiobiotin synthetase
MSTSRKASPPFEFDVSDYPPLPSLKGVMVVGTDTEVGKTLVAGAAARSLRRAGYSVEVFKPAASDCRRTAGGLVSGDAEFLAAAADSRRTLAEITPARLARALAPNVAAELEHRPVDLNAILAEYTRLEGQSDVVVVEGIGGLLCPITDAFWVIHFAKLTGLPLVVVARPGLGTINHTLLTIHAARTAGLRVAGVIINRYRLEPPTGETLEEAARPARSDDERAMLTNPLQIARLGRTRVLAFVPEEADNSVEQATIGRDTQYNVDQVPWEDICGL